MENNNEEKVLLILKQGEKSSTEIASLLKRNYYDAMIILNELETRGVIEKISLGNFTFWRIKDGKEI